MQRHSGYAVLLDQRPDIYLGSADLPRAKLADVVFHGGFRFLGNRHEQSVTVKNCACQALFQVQVILDGLDRFISGVANRYTIASGPKVRDNLCLLGRGFIGLHLHLDK